MKNHWVYDYETLPNCFLAVFDHYKKDLRKTFIVTQFKGTAINDIDKFIKFLTECISKDEWHISFNGLAFDAQITQYILNSKTKFLHSNPLEITRLIYDKAQEIIQRQNNKEFNTYRESELSIKQIDLFKLNHWDNPAKRSSLKWIEYSMDWYNIQDMPIHHTTMIENGDELNTILKYCINDVKATKAIYERSKDLIGLRLKLTKEYGINLISASEPKISRELFLHFLAEKTKVNKYDLRQSRTMRENIVFKDIILPYIKFKDEGLKNLLEKFKEIILPIRNTKGGFKHSVYYKGIRTDFGLGGLHGAADAGIYKESDGEIIMTSDVTSFYPNLAIRNKWAPAHLPQEEFCDQYEWFFEERKKIPKKDPKNYVYKIILNSTYGLSNDENSFLYDPEFTMRITINGQLLLTMLYEMICEGIPGARPLMQNTDGLETIIPKMYKDKYFEICKEWEKLTSLSLEHDQYQKIILADVNNYIAIHSFKEITEKQYTELEKATNYPLLKKENNKYYHALVKCKGKFEFDNLALHKNKSYLIIPKAVYCYFVHNTDPEIFLLNSNNIFDYCAGVKIKGDWKFVERKILNSYILDTVLQSTIRYYIKKNGKKIIKINLADNREIQVEAGLWTQEVLNKIRPQINGNDVNISFYDIDKTFYLSKITREIGLIERVRTQLKLF